MDTTLPEFPGNRTRANSLPSSAGAGRQGERHAMVCHLTGVAWQWCRSHLICSMGEGWGQGVCAVQSPHGGGMVAGVVPSPGAAGAGRTWHGRQGNQGNGRKCLSTGNYTPVCRNKGEEWGKGVVAW